MFINEIHIGKNLVKMDATWRAGKWSEHWVVIEAGNEVMMDFVYNEGQEEDNGSQFP